MESASQQVRSEIPTSGERLWVTSAIYHKEDSQKYHKVLTYKQRREGDNREECVGEVIPSTREETAHAARMYLCTGSLPVIPIDNTRCGIRSESGELVFLRVLQRARVIQVGKSEDKVVRFLTVESQPDVSTADKSGLKEKIKKSFSISEKMEALPRVRAAKDVKTSSSSGASKKKSVSKEESLALAKPTAAPRADPTLSVDQIVEMVVTHLDISLKSDMTSAPTELIEPHPDYVKLTPTECIRKIIATSGCKLLQNQVEILRASSSVVGRKRRFN